MSTLSMLLSEEDDLVAVRGVNGGNCGSTACAGKGRAMFFTVYPHQQALWLWLPDYSKWNVVDLLRDFCVDGD